MTAGTLKVTSAALPDFVKLADAFHAKGLRAKSVDELDAVIHEMLMSDTAVIADIAVDPKENCFPMIPSGAAHNEMILGVGRRRRGRDHRSGPRSGLSREKWPHEHRHSPVMARPVRPIRSSPRRMVGHRDTIS